MKEIEDLRQETQTLFFNVGLKHKKYEVLLNIKSYLNKMSSTQTQQSPKISGQVASTPVSVSVVKI